MTSKAELLRLAEREEALAAAFTDAYKVGEIPYAHYSPAFDMAVARSFGFRTLAAKTEDAALRAQAEMTEGEG